MTATRKSPCSSSSSSSSYSTGARRACVRACLRACAYDRSQALSRCSNSIDFFCWSDSRVAPSRVWPTRRQQSNRRQYFYNGRQVQVHRFEIKELVSRSQVLLLNASVSLSFSFSFENFNVTHLKTLDSFGQRRLVTGRILGVLLIIKGGKVGAACECGKLAVGSWQLADEIVVRRMDTRGRLHPRARLTSAGQ